MYRVERVMLVIDLGLYAEHIKESCLDKRCERFYDEVLCLLSLGASILLRLKSFVCDPCLHIVL